MSSTGTDIISSKTVYKTDLFEVFEYQLKLKNGKTLTHHAAKRRPTVTILPLTPEGDVYLIKQYRYMLKATALEAVAGFVENHESPLQAAKRELQEETGIHASSWESLGKIEMSASVFSAQAHIFLCRDIELGEAKPEEDEEITLVKMQLKEAVAKVFTGEITISASVIGILMIDHLLRK